MTREHLVKFADAVVKHYSPASGEEKDQDIPHNALSRKMEEIRNMVLNFTNDVGIAEKEEIANNAIQRLRNAYTPKAGIVS